MFLPLVKSKNDKWTACHIWLVMHEIMRSSRDHVSYVQHLEVTYSLKKLKNLQLFENLNDAYNNIDAYVCNLWIKLRWNNELLCSWEIANQHFERKECFSMASCEVLWEFWMKAKTWVFCCCATPIYNYDIFYSSVCNVIRVKKEQIILSMKIVNQYFERK